MLFALILNGPVRCCLTRLEGSQSVVIFILSYIFNLCLSPRVLPAILKAFLATYYWILVPGENIIAGSPHIISVSPPLFEIFNTDAWLVILICLWWPLTLIFFSHHLWQFLIFLMFLEKQFLRFIQTVYFLLRWSAGNNVWITNLSFPKDFATFVT